MADILVLSTANAVMSDYPLLLQASGGDAAISYTGPDFRQLIDVVTQAGVCTMGAFRVTQRGAGANLSVDIAAGQAVVTGTSVTRQGKFVCDSTGTVNMATITVPGTGTRTHRVILRARDKQASGTAYGWSLEVLEDTGSGMPALPASAIDLASISVAAGTGSITNAMITDRRSYACPSIPLSVQVLAVDTPTVLFDGIPGFIRALELTWSARCTGAGGTFVLGARINGDTAGNYARVVSALTNNGTATPTAANTADVSTYMYMGIVPGTASGAGLFAEGEASFPKWRTDGTSTRIRSLVRSGFWESLSNGAQIDGKNYWVGTAAPASITLVPSVGSLLTGSQFVLSALA
jgi:hypothetical protein